MTVTATSSTGNQIFDADVAGVLDDLGAALVAVFLADFFEFLDDDAAQNFLGAQDFQVFGDAPLDLGQFVEDLLLLHAGQALELQFDDGLRLLLAELAQRIGVDGPEINFVKLELRGRGHQRIARFLGRLRGADQPDHFVDVFESQLEAEQNMLALARFAQHVIGAPAHHIDAVLDEVLDGVDQAQFARLAVDDREIDDAEADLKLRLLIEIVEHHLGLLAALQFVNDAQAVAIAVVDDVRDAFDLLFVDQRGRSL